MNIFSLLRGNNFSDASTRSLLAGFLGGLAGTAVKKMVEEFLPVRKIEERAAKEKVIDDLSIQITGTALSKDNEVLAEELVGFPFGASIGAAYGYGKTSQQGFRPLDGIIFGATTWISTHETSLPLLGLKEKPKDVPLKLQANELFAHLAFGITTEFVRSMVDKKLK